MPIRAYTDLDQYYGDDNQWGQYQYVTIQQLVNEFMMSQTDDSYIAGVNRNRVVYWAKRGIQELYYDVLNEVISIEFDLNPTLIIPLPHDYVNYVMISWVDDNGRKHPLAIDTSSNLAQAYLQDDTYAYLYDNQGDILQGDHLQDLGDNDPAGLDDLSQDGIYFPYTASPNFNLDRSKVFKNGSYVIDKDRGVIQFSSKVEGRTICLDYISDGLFQRSDSEIRVHKFAEQALVNFIYWNLISYHRNVPANEKERARREWYNMRRIAKRRIKPIRYEELRQVMKGNSKFIKD